MQENRCHSDISMVILAGGASRRMGTDKARLLFQGQTFLKTQIEKGRSLGIQDIMVSGYHGEDAGVPVIPDNYPGKGPLGGLEACFRRASHEWCLVLSVDVPLVPAEELHKLIVFAKNSGERAVILRAGDQEQPLIAMYRRELADEAFREVLEYKGAVFAFLRRVGCAVYESSAPEDCFVNVNDPEKYEKYCR